MKKSWKSLTVCALSAVLACGFAACGESGEEDGADYDTPAVTTYDNKSYNAYLLGSEATIANQWDGYGIGDPFVMRYNGMYYLYVSTLDGAVGVRGYRSADLVNWAPMTGAGLEEGYVSQDSVTLTAYAPEVYYFNGTFYMYTSPGGNGHFVLASDSPAGPFTAVTDNFGQNIDGSVFIDDDETMYFTSSGTGENPGIRMGEMTDMKTIGNTRRLNGIGLGGWTEGPYILKRQGTYYLTYTGNHVASDAYRIAYATADSFEDGFNSAFTAAPNNPIALETETELKGIGHSSTVMGPDMDSYYLIYHYLNSSGGPNRSLGIDRLIFNGKMMSVAPNLEKSVKPALPAFYATGNDSEKFEAADGILLSKTAAPSTFTAEYNLSGSGSAEYVFGYTDANNYYSVKTDLSAKKISLTKTSDGSLSEVASGTFKNEFSADKLHTVRVSSRDGKVSVTFDNMTKIDEVSAAVDGGKIGYKGIDGAEIGYTAFSSVAFGMSDELEAKQIKSYIGADNYLRGNEYTKKAQLQEDAISVISQNESRKFAGWKKATLEKGGDQASYLVYNGQSGRYGLELIYPASDGGKKINVKIDGVKGGDVYACKLPEIKIDVDEGDDTYVRAVVGEFELTEGAHIVRLENAGKSVGYTAFRFVEASGVTPVFEHNLADYVLNGSDYKTIWKIQDGGHYAKAGTRQLVYFGDNSIGDFTMEAEIKFDGATGTSTAGLVFHAKNYASSPHEVNPVRSIQGYYLGLRNIGINLQRLDYENTKLLDSESLKSFASDEFHKLKVEMRGSRIRVWVNEEAVFDFTDGWGFSNGKVGLYTDGAAAVFRNLKIGK